MLIQLASFLNYHLGELNMGDEEVAHLLCVNFNQDAKSLAVGHQNGYILYTTADVLDASVLLHDADSTPNIHDAIIVERLFNSSLVVIVSQKEPRVMHIYHFSSKNMICNHKFTKSILNVKLNRDRVVVCLEDCIHIYNLKDMKLMHTILDTPLNRLGLIDLSPAGSSLIAYPGSADTGSVHIFDSVNLSAVNTFAAHDGPLACLKYDSDGTMIATASTKGTVIRVYSVPQGSRLYEFRRGMSRCVSIHSLAFSADSTYLCSSSNTETVHVFKLEKPEDLEKKQEPVTETSSWLGYLTQAASSYLPTQVNELMTVERSFATAKLPGTNKRNVAALPTIKGQPHLLVATTDGFLYCYRLDSSGGECDLVKMHRIGPNTDGNKGDAASVHLKLMPDSITDNSTEDVFMGQTPEIEERLGSLLRLPKPYKSDANILSEKGERVLSTEDKLQNPLENENDTLASSNTENERSVLVLVSEYCVIEREHFVKKCHGDVDKNEVSLFHYFNCVNFLIIYFKCRKFQVT
uniref:WD repeat domain phosphoinositide-interacting protein 2 n=1 Tax=Heterorhabditis bacteriophora TaxID=37862 RepID=A0A1I7XM42_HETBA